jgi:hypothetical protein
MCAVAGGELVTAGFVRVDPVVVAAGSAHLESSVGDAAVAFIVHEDQLVGAASGWIGESAKALSEVLARWETCHTRHKRRAGELGYHMATAGIAFIANEEHSAQVLSAIEQR